MKYEYELACKEAGMPEENIAELRRMFDADKKKLKRLNRKLESQEDAFCILHLSDFHVEDQSGDFDYDAPDLTVDVEEDVMHSMMLDQMRGFLGELNQEDRRFILTYFSFKNKAVHQTAKLYHCTERQAAFRRDRIIAILREKFSEEI